jgi:spore coat protein CotF
MSARKGSRPVFSLLAFQDIITSVSGILMFLVLMLSLEMSNEATPDSPVIDVKDLQRLGAAVEEARREQAKLAASLATANDVTRQLAGMTTEQLQMDIQHLDRQIEELTASTSALTSRRDALLSQKSNMTAAAERTSDVVRQSTEQALKEAADLAKELSDVQKDDRPIFTLPRGFDRKGWLVVVSSDRCEAAPLGVRAAPRQFPVGASGFLKSTVDVSGFLSWTTTAGGNSYFLLVVRPGGAEVFDAIREDFEKRSVAFGFDLVGAGRKLLDPEKGASQ